MAMARSVDVVIRPFRNDDLAIANRIISLAFGTFLKVPEPATFIGDANYAMPRFRTDPTSIFVAELDGSFVGSNFASHWGSVAFFGPLTIHPDHWNKGIGQKLIAPVVELFDSWGATHTGLFTFPHSPKHIALYQKFGFWPRYLACFLAKPIEGVKPFPKSCVRFSELAPAKQADALKQCLELTDAIYNGLDLRTRVQAAYDQRLGDTVLVFESGKLDGFALCYFGAGTEAGSQQCLIKFAAANTAKHFDMLLDGCEALASALGAPRLAGAVSTARHEAYCHMLSRGHKMTMQNIAMHRPNVEGYHRAGVYVVDDWW
jgi:GNAT superfamily N-acetyltransferase